MSFVVFRPPPEIVNPHYVRGPFRCAIFDFDGTLSLLRGNWQGLMVPMMVEALAATGSGESREQLTAIVEEFVTRLTGQPTMQQMFALADEVEKRGQPRPDPYMYFDRYMDMLISQTEGRIAEVQAGQATPDRFLVPGARLLIEKLLSERLILVIASGTNLADVRRESAVLNIDHYFGSRVFGPVNDDPSFSKERVLSQLMTEHSLRGEQIVSIGDGPAEMLAVKAAGGFAVGVASDEIHQDGRVNQLKRNHLLRSGADVIIPDYRDLSSVLRLLTPAA
ncbi:MAG: HAD family hydrolase [Planctomycetia bacterium]|nr:HAD family hydrolase [Planctomycetia bacterium]